MTKYTVGGASTNAPEFERELADKKAKASIEKVKKGWRKERKDEQAN